MEIALYILLGLLVGSVLAFLILRGQVMNLKKEKKELEQSKNETEQQKYKLQTDVEVLKKEKEYAALQVERVESAYKERLEQTSQSYREQLEQIERSNREQRDQLEETFEKQIEQQIQLLKEQLSTTSEKILKERSAQLSDTNQQQLSAILNPLNEHIKQMREAVEKSDKEHAETMVRLDETIKTSMEQSRQVGETADKLALALTGENKIQGNFGELRLRQLLEGMGLERGLQFEEQQAMKDEKGNVIQGEEGSKGLIPDVVLHFPENRDLIIDSKVSLTAFEEYYNAEAKKQKDDALKKHVASVKAHVNELSKKDYSKYILEGHRQMDFVIMFMFSDNALQLALNTDPSLWRWAYEKHVVITGSQNLFPLLRVLEMSWNQVRQVENLHEIMKTANQVIDRVQLFSERFEAVEDALKKAQDAVDGVKSVCSDKGQSIIVAASNLLKYGAQENPKRKRSLPKSDN